MSLPYRAEDVEKVSPKTPQNAQSHRVVLMSIAKSGHDVGYREIDATRGFRGSEQTGSPHPFERAGGDASERRGVAATPAGTPPAPIRPVGPVSIKLDACMATLSPGL